MHDSTALLLPVQDDESNHSVQASPKSDRPSRFVIILTLFVTIGGFLFGYDTGVISGALLLVTDEYDLSSIQQEWIIASTTAGAMVGALVAGQLADRLGRRPTVMIAAFIFTAGAVLMGAANGFVMLLLGRIVVGVGVGLASMTVPLYIAEIAPAAHRGAMVTLNVLFITGGQFVAYIVAAGFANVPDGWRYMLGLSGLPAVIQFVGMIFLPESPRYLLRMKKQIEARRVLTRMGVADVEEEMNELMLSISSQAAEHASWRELLDPRLRRALIIGICLQAFQQLAGINTVMYYSSTILKMAGFPDNQTAIFFSIFVAFTNMVFTIVGMYLIDRAGRRPLLVYTLPGCIAGLALLGGAFYMMLGVSTKQASCDLYTGCAPCQLDTSCGFCTTTNLCLAGNSDGPFSDPAMCPATDWIYNGACAESDAGGWMALASLVFYVAFFAVGMGPVPWAIQAEIFPIGVRGMANGIATASNWTANLIVSSTLLTLFHSISQAGTFWLYCGFAFTAWVFVIQMVPETKGRTLEEISRDLNK